MNIVFFVEEPSMKICLDAIMKKVFPDRPDVVCQYIAFQGKDDLEKRLPIKLKGWSMPDTKFVVVRDQDEEDCVKLKERLVELSSGYGRDVLVRIVCHELEAWYFGDLRAVDEAYGTKLEKLAGKKRFRDPDAIHHPKRELKKHLPELQQILGARKIAPKLDPGRNTSRSFRALVDGVRRLADGVA